jgi:pantetheine-phosphate adenylyltransferase
MKKAIYPGSFDPVTFGHLDVIKRALALFDLLIVAVAEDSGKQSLFTAEERVDLLKESTKDLGENILIESFKGLLVDYMKSNNIKFIIRGLRAISDFEHELQLATINRKIDSDVDTVFLMTNEDYFFLNSSIVKEIARLGGNVEKFVPKVVADKLRQKFS